MNNGDSNNCRKRIEREWIRHYHGQSNSNVNGQVNVSVNSGNGGNDRNGMNNGDLVPELALNRLRPTWNVLNLLYRT